LAALLLSAGLGEATPIKHPDFRGHFDAGKKDESKVKIEVIKRRGRRLEVHFEARGLKMICVDGTQFTTNLRTLRIDFVNRHTFYADHLIPVEVRGVIEELPEPIGVIIVKGRIRDKGRIATGYVYVLEVDRETGAACATSAARQTWRASRVGGG